ncbi:GIY-YIG nuclease family protein [Priestia aryabhattai]
MSSGKSSEWKEYINKHNTSLSGREIYARLKVDHDTRMHYIQSEEEMATKETTIKIVQALLKLVSLPEERYNSFKKKQDRIIKEREINYFKKHYEKSKSEIHKEGYVYFLKEYHGYSVKIGYSKDPLKRINQMIFVPSIPVEIIHTIKSKNAHRLEQMFHLYYSSKRLKDGYTTEFFELTEEDMQNIYNRNLPEEMLHLIIEEEYNLPPRLKRLERRKWLEQEKEKES